MDAQEIRDIIGDRTGGYWGIRGLCDDVEYGNDDSEWILFGDWFHPVEIEAVWTDGEVA